MSLNEDVLYVVLPHLWQREFLPLCTVSKDVHRIARRGLYRNIVLREVAAVRLFHLTVFVSQQGKNELNQLVLSLRCELGRGRSPAVDALNIEAMIADIISALPNLTAIHVDTAPVYVSSKEVKRTLASAIASRSKLRDLAVRDLTPASLIELLPIRRLVSLQFSLWSTESETTGSDTRQLNNSVILVFGQLSNVKTLLIPLDTLQAVLGHIRHRRLGPFDNVLSIGAPRGHDQPTVTPELVQAFPQLRFLSADAHSHDTRSVDLQLGALQHLDLLYRRVEDGLLSQNHHIVRLTLRGNQLVEYTSVRLKSLTSPHVRALKIDFACSEPAIELLARVSRLFPGLTALDVRLADSLPIDEVVQSIPFSGALSTSLVVLSIHQQLVLNEEHLRPVSPIGIQTIEGFARNTVDLHQPVGGSALQVLRIHALPATATTVAQWGAWRIDRELYSVREMDWEDAGLLAVRLVPELGEDFECESFKK
ncbi:hypothetical protein BKA62DRAFT_713773 [Auriculariales sp. MPI-PUGE-AT-0066]|nr:hypothetical protein BKA62DRAFT_713773 [Auriculariales sp. MPI-PUGE-AT-0066]